MNISRFALILSLATAVLWTAKAFAIAAAGGLGRSPLEGPFFLAGLACAVVAAAVTGIALARRRRVLVRVLSCLGTVVAVSLLGTVTQVVVTAAQPTHPGWAWGEINLWMVAIALVVLNVTAIRGRRPVIVPEPVRVS